MTPHDTARHDRRTFLKTSGSIAVVGLTGMAGCLGGQGDGGDGGDGGGQATPSPTATLSSEAQEVREKYGLEALDYDLEDQLNIFQWGDYWPDGTVQNFERAYGVDVNVSNYASNEEMFNKLKAGGTGQYDLIFPSDYMVNILVEQGMVQPLDLGKVPNFDNLSSTFEEAPYDPDSERHSAPYQWGTSGIGYHSGMIGEVDITSWDAMWNEEWAGQMTMLNDMRETIGAALKRLGYSLNTTDEDEITEAKETLIQQKQLLQAYDSSNFSTNLINQQASPVHGWSGGIFQAYWELYSDGSTPINYVIPEEGSVVWVDTAAITAEASNVNAAHAFINYFLNARVGAEITNWVYYGSPNEAAEEHISDDILNNPSIYPPDDVMAKLEFIENVGDATTLYSEAWTEIQSA